MQNIDWKSTGAIEKNIKLVSKVSPSHLKSSGGPRNLSVTLSFLPGAGPRPRCRERSSGPTNQTRTVHQRSTNQIRPHCTATYLGQLSLHLHHKVAPALFGSRLLCFGLSNRPYLPRGQHDFRPKPTTYV